MKTQKRISALTTTFKSVIVTNINDGVSKKFISIRRTADFVNENELHISCIIKSKSLYNQSTSKGN